MADSDSSFLAALEAIRAAGARNTVSDTNWLAALASAQPAAPSSLLGDILDSYRPRASWNDRFAHWEKAETVSEEGSIEKAQKKVRVALATNTWVQQQQISICCQGSYQNRTNVRTEADIDLRAQHPAILVEYAPDVLRHYVDVVVPYGKHGLTYQQIFDTSRAQLHYELAREFGAENVTPGTKAFRIKGITGSKAEVDVVPTVEYHYVSWLPHLARYDVTKGVAILSTDGQWTINYPGLHEANGIAKRARTAHRFKKMVRVFKRMRADLKDRGLISVGVPSFLIECLVYEIEDCYFLVEIDDRYDRVRRIALRMKEKLDNVLVASNMKEINGIKPLFGVSQNWSRSAVQEFVNASIRHLGDA